MTTLQIRSFLSNEPEAVIVDVRSPKEFENGHIPGAVNIPLFDNEERKTVGIKYSKEGKSKAVKHGLKLAGPKMSGYIDQLEEAVPDKLVKVYCWRGGMRSSSMAWLFEKAGYDPVLLEKGYKAFRNLAEHIFDNHDIFLLGGETGAGKTEVLGQLKILGQQVVDLEELANHKGSAFGGMGEPPQPTTEHFQNEIISEFMKLDPSMPVFIEDESAHIGKVGLPEPLWQKMKLSPIIHISVPKSHRIKNLVRTYGQYDPDLIEQGIAKISRKLGGQSANNAIRYLHEDKLDLVANEVLEYYDKSYRLLLGRNQQNIIETIKVENPDPKSIARSILQRTRSNVLPN